MKLKKPKTIKFDIQEAMKKLTTQEIKNQIEVARHNNGPRSIFLFTFGLNELENRMHPMEYRDYENKIAEL